MADALATDYEINKLRSLRSLKLSVRHLRRTFAVDRTLDITTDRIKKYIRSRQGEGAANASVNRELSALKRMFKLAVESGRLRFSPHVPMLEENNARQGFVDHSVFLTMREHLPAYLKDPVTFLYLSGWRLGEVLLHDLRRTAVRNMVRAGIPDRIAMALSGHKTRSVFDRYNIVSEEDLALATERLQSHLHKQAGQRR